MIPRLLLIADGFATGSEAVAADDIQRRTLRAVEAGVPWVQLRDHDADGERFRFIARSMIDQIRSIRSDAIVSVNGYTDLASELDLALHVGRRGPAPTEARERVDDGLLTVAVHNRVELGKAKDAQADAALFSPVFRTLSKPRHPGAGLETLSDMTRAAGEMPLIALGGITPTRAGLCANAGAHGVAVVSAILSQRDADIPAVVDDFLSQLE